LLAKVHASGYRDTFIIQDLIPGDDAGLRITNSYVDAQGKVCYTVFGHILLQEHTPSTVGNSSVVLTSQEPASVAALERLLEGIGWRGFGSFDMKVDPRTGEMVFFELNPRLSRSNYYVTGAGLNPAVAYVRDWVLNEPVVAEGESGNARPSLFMVVPRALMWRYLLDEDVKRQVRALRRKGAIVNPLWNRRERNLKRLAFVLANQANHFRKYRRFYPRNVQLAEREVAREAARKAQGQA
jgi:D-aspartate ligase